MPQLPSPPHSLPALLHQALVRLLSPTRSLILPTASASGKCSAFNVLLKSQPVSEYVLGHGILPCRTPEASSKGLQPMEGSLLLPLSACIVLPIQVQQAGRAWEGLQSRQRQLSRRRRRAWRRLCLAAAARPLSRLAYGAPPISRWALSLTRTFALVGTPICQRPVSCSFRSDGRAVVPENILKASVYSLCLTMGL